MARRKQNSYDLAARFGLAGMHTGITLWHRFPMLALACASPGKPNAEVSRMMNEKMSAAVEGTFQAQREFMRIAAATMTGRLDFSDMANLPSAIAAAGLRPAFRTVKANSRRLSRNS